MNAHDQRVAQAAHFIKPKRYSARHHLRDLDRGHLARRLVVFTASTADIDRLVPRARLEMGGGAPTEIVHRIARHNPDSLWAIARRNQYASGEDAAEGYLAFLMLNDEGMRRLLSGRFDATNPDMDCLVGQNEKPAGIYVWGVYARGAIAGGVPLALEKVWAPLYRNVSLYARAVTGEGKRMLETLGFQRGATFGGKFAFDFHCFPRGKAIKDTRPVYDNYLGADHDDDVSITVARSIEDIMKVVAIRGATFISEQDCPYDEEFDGNDFSAGHLLSYVGNEPVGCLRIRYFADFAQLERLAVRREFRSRQIGRKLMSAGVELCRMKGYRQIYGRAQKDLFGYYESMGWKQLEGSQEFAFSDHAYIEIVFDAARHPSAITLGLDPYVLMRPEGRWQEPGILDRSATRKSPSKFQETNAA